MLCTALRVIAVILVTLSISSAFAEENRFPFQKGDTLAGAVPSPDAFFGVPLGSRFTPHHEMLAYYRKLEATSDRIIVRPYGRTAEGRELVLCFIGSPETLRRLTEIQALQGELADPRRRDGNPDEIDTLLGSLPAVLWLSYNVHGNEASASEAALWTVYQLIDGTDPASKQIREDALVIVDPCLNPDGHERYQNWFRSVATESGNPDPRSREHDEPWPGGRSNHFLFDLNRDWAWQSQPETRARIAEYIQWWHLIHDDFHEMSPESSYFFFPPEEPINENVSEITLAWSKTIGLANAHAFDRFGWSYYTGESFDLFYPAYGDSWPTLQGAVGMTYEQAGGARGGVRYLRRDGPELTLAARLHHHHVAGMATLLASVKEKTRLQTDFHRFRQEAIEVGRSGDVVEFLFPPQSGGRLEPLIALLEAQGIEVTAFAEDALAEDLRDYHGASHEVTKLPAGTRSIRLDQPTGRLARALLEPRATASDAFFYDVSAWCLPMAMGVEGFICSGPFSAIRVPAESDPRAGHVEGEAKVAYLFAWEGIDAVRALASLHRRGVRAQLVPTPILSGGRHYAAGSIVVPVLGAATHSAVQAVAKECAVTFYGVDSGWTDEGIDLGSDQVETLRPPRIAVASGEGVSSLSFGAVWSLFEQTIGATFSAISLDTIGSRALDEYDVLILPTGSGYRGALDEGAVASLRAWLRAGGTIVAFESAAFALGAEGVKLSGRKTRTDEPPRDEEDPQRKTISELRKEREERQVPGNIFRVTLDPEHPLAFGHPETMFAFMDGTRTFALEGDGGDVAAFTEEPAASGFISDENVDKVRRRVFLAEERVGRGHVVLFAGDPCFRGFWRGSTGLLLNAVYLRSTY